MFRPYRIPLVSAVAIACALVVAQPSSVIAAVETTTVQGKVYLPGGSVATGGTIRATLSDSGSADDGGTSQRVAGRVDGTIGADGTVTLALVPNDVITPTGTYYNVSFRVTGPERASWTEKWSVTTSPDPVDVGAITRLEVGAGLTVGDFVVYVSTEPSGACTTADAPTYAVDTNTICECVSSTWTCGITAASLAANGANCAAGEIPLGVDASGAAEGCYEPTEADISDLAHTATAVASDASEGTCSASERYQIKTVTGGAGVADEVVMCLKDSADAYAWVSIAVGG